MEAKLKKLHGEPKWTGLVVQTKEIRINSYVETKLTTNTREIEQVESFFGSIVTTTGGAEEDVNNRIRKSIELLYIFI